MENQKIFTVEVRVDETENRTNAKAVTTIGPTTAAGSGQARRNPSDPNVPHIGEQLATARALSDLGHKLLDAAADAIEAREGRPVHLHE